MENDTLIILSILSGTLFTFVLILTIVLVVVKYQKNKVNNENKHKEAIQNKELEMLKRVIETQETERQKIASNLHDEINPLLVSIKHVLTSQSIELTAMGIDSTRISNQKEVIDRVIENIQSSTRDLSPRILYLKGLVSAIRGFLRDIEGIEISYEFTGEEYFQNTETINLNLYRISLELINNIRKYEDVKWLHVSLKGTENSIVLVIAHDGKGMTNEQFEQHAAHSKGIGLNSIISRVKLLGASLDFKRDPSVEIILAVPLIHAR